MARRIVGWAALILALVAGGAAGAAEPVMVQCGREYQAAKAAGTLGAMDWNRYRADCAARLKAAPAGEPAPPAPAAAGAAPVAAPAQPPAVAAAASKPAAATGGRAAATARQRQCGAEWRAGKAALVAATPGLTWPRYWSQCNARLKAAGQ